MGMRRKARLMQISQKRGFGPDPRGASRGNTTGQEKNRLTRPAALGNARRGATGGVNRSSVSSIDFLRIIDVNVMLLKKRTRRREKKN
ncbi:hypothetical protein Tco_0168002 [Tanacetum coccineum]